MDVQRIADELEIVALLNKYARAVDTKDWALYRSLFTEDAYIDYTAAGFIAGTRDECADFLSQRQAEITSSMHYVMNVESHIDGTTAETQAMWLNAVRPPGASDTSFFGGHWRHVLVKTPGGWRSRNLKLDVVW